MTQDERPLTPVPPEAPVSSPGPPPEQAAPPAPTPTRSPRRWWRVVAWSIPLVMVAVAGLIVGAYIFVLTQVTVGQGGTAQGPETPLFAWPLRVVDRVNILLIGVDVTLDTRRRVVNIARADTLVLLTIDPARRHVAVVSIPRDTRVIIPGIGENKVNASYAYGGPRLTIRTVEQLLAVRVHYYVKLGPESFAHLIDAIGGLEIDVEKPMRYTDSWAGYTIDLKPGLQHLTGEQVTGYIRFRHDALGDIARVERQRRVMGLLIQRLKTPSTVLYAPGLLRAFAKNTETNLSAIELISLGAFALRVRDLPLHEQTLPGSFAPLYWEPDFGKIRPMVADLFYGLSEEDLAQTPVEVRNGSGVPGLARRAGARLQEVGFRNVRVDPAAASSETTAVIYRGAASGAARLAAAALGRAEVRQDTDASGGPAVTVIIAREPAGRAQGTIPRRSGHNGQ